MTKPTCSSRWANVCRTTILRRAWYRGQRIEVHGLIYGLRDGLLRQDGQSWRERYEASLQSLDAAIRADPSKPVSGLGDCPLQ